MHFWAPSPPTPCAPVPWNKSLKWQAVHHKTRSCSKDTFSERISSSHKKKSQTKQGSTTPTEILKGRQAGVEKGCPHQHRVCLVLCLTATCPPQVWGNHLGHFPQRPACTQGSAWGHNWWVHNAVQVQALHSEATNHVFSADEWVVSRGCHSATSDDSCQVLRWVFCYRNVIRIKTTIVDTNWSFTFDILRAKFGML